MALALMREARSLQHIAYSFLTYWRILEVAVGNGKIKQWIIQAKDRIASQQVKETIKMIEGDISEPLSEHLYTSGRCAIAHAGNKPIIDPDQPEHSWRLAREIPIIQALAVLAIEEKLAVQTSYTIYKEHLYELGGFKRIFGNEIVKIFLDKANIPDDITVDIPIIDIGLMNRDPFPAFQNLLPLVMNYEGEVVQLVFVRGDGLFKIQFSLNFAEEHLEFDIHNAVFGIPDDGSSIWANIQAEMSDFYKWYYLNGCLIIKNSQTGELIARKDEFIPINCYVQADKCDEETKKWQEIAKQRQEAENKPQKL